MVRSHCRSDQLDQGRSSQITHFTQSKLDQMLDRTSTRALPDRYSIVYDPHPTIHDSSRTSPRQPHRFLLEHTDLYTINTRSINGQYSNSTRPPRPTRRLHDLYKILTRACPSPSKIRLELTIWHFILTKQFSLILMTGKGCTLSTISEDEEISCTQLPHLLINTSSLIHTFCF